jgi:hypothetical protein
VYCIIEIESGAGMTICWLFDSLQHPNVNSIGNGDFNTIFYISHNSNGGNETIYTYLRTVVITASVGEFPCGKDQ